MLFQAPSFIQGISTLKDKTLKLTVYIARELVGEEKAKLFDLEQKEGWFLCSENIIQEADVPEDSAKFEREKKSPSQRLYNVMFVYWQQQGSSGDFNQWRETQMERIIEQYKNKLI